MAPNHRRTSGKKDRIDSLLVSRELFASADEAARACMAGEVTSPSITITRGSQIVDVSIELNVRGRSAYVSRGGDKLKGALDSLEVDPTGLSCIDVGASSGGFTDCLLQHGAASVCAVDVGYGQFAWRLRQDPRVSLFERTNIKKIGVDELGGPFDLLVADVSFISLSSLLGTFRSLLLDGGMLLVLVKPQFEIEKGLVGEGGVVRDAGEHAMVLRKVVSEMPGHGFAPTGVCASPLHGPKGNAEFFVCALKQPDVRGEHDCYDVGQMEKLEGMIVNAVAAAHEDKVQGCAIAGDL